MPTQADAPESEPAPFPRPYRPCREEREALAAAWAERPPRRAAAVRSGEVPEEDPTRPGWWPERWDGLA